MNNMNQKKTTRQKTTQQKRMDILVRLALILAAVMILFFFVVKPMLKKDYYFEAGEDYKFDNLGAGSHRDSFAVAVAGDGIDAVSSALGAARVGAKTLLIWQAPDFESAFKSTLDVNWAADYTPTGNSVSSDLFKELRYKSGEGSNLDNYISEIKKLVSEQKKLTVLFDAKINNVSLKEGKLTGLEVKTPSETRNIEADRYIDASRLGDLLLRCGTPYTRGYEDIGINGLYQPVQLNFTVAGVDYAKIQELLRKQSFLISYYIKEYTTGDRNIRISGLNAADQGNGKVVIQAVNVDNLDLSDEAKVKAAYEKAKKECQDFYIYIKANLDEFKASSEMTVAEEFVMPSPYHFKGRYTMTLSDVLTGKRYTDRISTASKPVTFTMDDGNRYVLCNPKTFYIPLGSIIPEGLDNVLMTGDKISASSLIQTAIGSNSSKTGNGYAAGIIAAYSISRDMEIPMLIEDRNLDTQEDIEKILRKMGIYMSDIKEDVKSITGNWSYIYAEKLINLGLLSGGITNDYKYTKEAREKDLAYIILNGVPRVNEAAYNYSFDAAVRKYITDEPLKKENFGRILLELTGKKAAVSGSYYEEACKLGLIDDTLQKQLKNSDVLLMSEVYYGSVKLLERLTGREIK